MARNSRETFSPRIANRKAMHEYFITAKLECGIALLGSEVKSLRQGKCQLAESYARVEGRDLILHGCHIDPYEKATVEPPEPRRARKLLAHRREIKRLQEETERRGMTLIPLAVYFKHGIVKLELGVATGKQRHDKRESIKRKEQDREVRRATTKRM